MNKIPRHLSTVAVLRTAADLGVLRDAQATTRRIHVALEIPGIPPTLARQWENRLNEDLGECGCSMGARCVGLALAASAGWQCFHWTWNVSSWAAFLLRTTLLAFAAGGLGKIVGSASARFRIRRIARRLADFARAGQERVGHHVDMYQVGG